MGDVKWIKLYTTLPDHRKIKQIRKLPDGDTIALMWVFLLCLAGETNDEGMVYITREVPYTDEMLANQFDMDINTVRMGLQVFEQFGMIEIINNILCLSNWEKYQAVDKMTEIREYNRLAQQRHREKVRQEKDVIDTSLTSQLCQGTDKDIDKDKEIELDIEDIELVDVEKEIKREKRKAYGEYKNVLLSDSDIEKLKAEAPDTYLDYIEKVSSYVEKFGKPYKNYLAAIRDWMKRDKNNPQVSKSVQTDPGRAVTHTSQMDDPQMKEWLARSQSALEKLRNGK